jgi:endoglycosylceramidase
MSYFLALVLVFFLCLISIVTSKTIIFLWRFLGLPNFKKKVYFRDSYNRIKIYRGVNVCNYAKTANDYLPWHTKEDYIKLKQCGFNLVRFLIFWENIEPQKEKYNFEYIQKVKEHIQILEQLNIDVIIDIHQDLYNKKFSGNGFPDWALPKEEYKFKTQSKWYLNYLQPAVIKSYKHFWENNKLHSRYFSLISFIYESLNMYKNVIGIDVMNEPFPNFPYVFSFEENTLNQFYQNLDVFSKANGFIRKLFLEPWIAASTGLPTYLDKKLFNGRNFYLPHYYPPFCHTEGKYNWFSKLLTNIAIRSKTLESNLLNSPTLIGEVGIYSCVKNYLKFINDFVNLSEKHQVNWIWYSYDKIADSAQGLINEDLSPNKTLLKLIRVYPQKIAGKKPKFYTRRNVFYFECEYDASITGNTEIFTIPGETYKITSNAEYIMDKNILKFCCLYSEKTYIKVEWKM